MSVEYYLVCHKHKSKFWTCSDGFSGPVNQLDSSKKLASFIITHKCCDLNVIDENNDDCDDYESADELDWKDIVKY